MLHLTQELEPPANPARFIVAFPSLAFDNDQTGSNEFLQGIGDEMRVIDIQDHAYLGKAAPLGPVVDSVKSQNIR